MTRITTSHEVFASASSVLAPAYRRAITHIAAALVGRRGAVSVVGHTDAQQPRHRQGPDNLALSRQRAEVVADVLRASAARWRVSATGASATQPVADNATAAGRRANRRVEITVTEDD